MYTHPMILKIDGTDYDLNSDHVFDLCPTGTGIQPSVLVTEEVHF
jgi:hypothetical protein